MIKLLFTIFGILLLFFSGCGFSQSIEEADNVMKSFFENRIEEGTAGDNSYYSDLFMESTGIEEWDRIKSLVMKANGKLISFEKTGWQVQNKANTSELSGTFVHYSYKIIYENGEGTEILSLFKNSENPTFNIIKHNYQSPRIQELINQSIDEAIKSDS